MKFICATCGAEHEAGSVSFGARAPVQWNLLTAEERERSELGEDDCVIYSEEGASYYIRACLEIPILGQNRRFDWGVWCSLSEQSMIEMVTHFSEPDRERFGPYFGWLCTALPTYPDTVYLKTFVRQRPPGLRPLVELEDIDHPLAVDQRKGMEPDRLQALVEYLLHST